MYTHAIHTTTTIADSHPRHPVSPPQMDVRDFMHKKCDQMKDVDPVQCKETADQVADNVESALQSLYDTLDEDTVCAAFCPAPAPPTMLTQLQQAAARMVVQQ